MTATRMQAVANAARTHTYSTGMCARFTRECFEVGALGDFDGDGDADAVDQWKAARLKNQGDRNPPAGVPVFWSGGSKGHGHAAVSLGGGFVRSTDWPSAGLVGNASIDEIERRWGLPYLGWSEDLYGNEIPDPEGDAARERRRIEAKIARKKAKRRAALDEARRMLAGIKSLGKRLGR